MLSGNPHAPYTILWCFQKFRLGQSEHSIAHELLCNHNKCIANTIISPTVEIIYIDIHPYSKHFESQSECDSTARRVLDKVS